MQLTQRIMELVQADDRAVSPVIGVILMVAITVILAAVIGTFVLDLGGSVQQQAPQASLTVQDHTDDYTTSADDNIVTIEHDGGDDLSISDMRVQLRNNSDNALQMEFDGSTFSTSASAATDGNLTLNGNDVVSSDIVSTGDQLVIHEGNTGGELSDDTKYKVVVLDKETGKSIVESTITLR